MRRAHEGEFLPKNLDKYLGDYTTIMYRSNLEFNAFVFCDNNPFVLRWGSEIIKIPYMKPHPDGSIRPSIYIPDIYVEFMDKNQQLKKVLLEVKPEKFINKSKSKKRKTAIVENYTYMINMIKAEAAQKWCSTRGIEYRFALEKNIMRS
jgi:hypothetical protein